MIRVRILAVAIMSVALISALGAEAQERSRRGFRGPGRGSLLLLLRLEQVQEEMKLDDEQKAKVKELVEKLGSEARDEFMALREIDDREAQIAKMTELSDRLDEKVREGLRDVVQREQVMRLYQIRLQVQPVVDSLANRYVARRLELTDDQKERAAELKKETQAEQMEVLSGMREATDEERGEIFAKYRSLRDEADKKALKILTAEQKESFEEMKGEKMELELGRR